MSGPAAQAVEQPTSFAFTPENLEKAQRIIAKYPTGKQASAMLPLLDLAQRQHDNWLPRAAMDYVADMLKVPRIRAYEVATFYTMYNKQPVGEFLVQVCRTTPCWLRGSDAITHACEKKLGVHLGERSADGRFTLVEVECLGACANAPMVQINDDVFEDLTPESMTKLLEQLQRGETPVQGSQIGRKSSCPEGGPTTLLEPVGVPAQSAGEA